MAPEYTGRKIRILTEAVFLPLEDTLLKPVVCPRVIC